MFPVSRRDTTTFQLSCLHIKVIEGQLLSVDIQAAYDRHRDLLRLRDQ
jgi:hypothetical protein